MADEHPFDTGSAMARSGGIAAITVDLSDWGLGEWPEDICNLVRVVPHDKGFTIEFDASGPSFENVARSIAQEVIEVFVGAAENQLGMMFDLQPDGLEIFSEEMSRPVLVSWDRIYSDEDSREATFDALRRWMSAQAEK